MKHLTSNHLLIALILFTVQAISTTDLQKQANDILSSMTPDEKIGQLFIADLALPFVEDPSFQRIYSEQTKTENYSLTDIETLLRETHIGGVFFKHLPGVPAEKKGSQETVKVLCARFEPLAMKKIKPILGIDAEWGLAMRTRDGQEYPKNGIIAQLGDSNLAEEIAYHIGRQARSLGLNYVAAPVADVIVEDCFIGLRSFGTNPALVSRYCMQAALGYQRSGILYSPKHFPGHGKTGKGVDSHFGLPFLSTQSVSREQFDQEDLLPFRDCIQHAPMLMLGHLVIEAIDPDRPTSLSPKVAQIVRKAWGNTDIVLLTDAMDMGAISKYYEQRGIPVADIMVQANLDALEANDILLFARRIPQTIVALKAELEAGKRSWTDIDAKVLRIIKAKLSVHNFADTIDWEEEKAFTKQVADAAKAVETKKMSDAQLAGIGK